MLFNRKLQVSFVKDDKKSQATPPAEQKTPIDYVAIATEVGRKALIGTCVVIVTLAVSNAAGQIAVNNLSPRKDS